MAKPNQNIWGISPKKGADFSCNLDGIVNPEPLQGLNVKNTIVEFAICAFVAVNTLSLTKDLSTHRDSPFPRAASRET